MKNEIKSELRRIDEVMPGESVMSKCGKPMTFRPTIFTARWLADRRAEGWNQSAIINNALANFIKTFKYAK
jgi:hypothetical protein